MAVPDSPRARRSPALLVPTLLLLPLLLVPAPALAAAYSVPPEDYAPYQPQRTCPKGTRAKPGTRALARWIEAQYDGGPALATKRGCGSGGTSEHKDGRAIDWMMDATRKADRLEVRRFLDRIFRTNAKGHEHAVARRMGVMYVIWNDRMWASYDRFDKKAYPGSVSCRRSGTCSPSVRHRNHVHVSLSRPGGRGDTSFYENRL